MNFILNQHIEKLESLKGQLLYTEEALTNNLENWERKEYEAIKSEYIQEIKDLEEHIELCKSL